MISSWVWNIVTSLTRDGLFIGQIEGCRGGSEQVTWSNQGNIQERRSSYVVSIIILVLSCNDFLVLILMAFQSLGAFILLWISFKNKNYLLIQKTCRFGCHIWLILWFIIKDLIIFGWTLFQLQIIDCQCYAFFFITMPFLLLFALLLRLSFSALMKL